MEKLGDLASLIRSKNAGPFIITIDVMFEDIGTYERVCASGVINSSKMSEIFGLPAKEIRIYMVSNCLAIKISMPRRVTQDDLADTDSLGGQQFVPLLDLRIGHV
jgi:hypothetical protein